MVTNSDIFLTGIISAVFMGLFIFDMIYVVPNAEESVSDIHPALKDVGETHLGFAYFLTFMTLGLSIFWVIMTLLLYRHDRLVETGKNE
jgi:type II secretory pathway component PulF